MDREPFLEAATTIAKFFGFCLVIFAMIWGLSSLDHGHPSPSDLLAQARRDAGYDRYCLRHRPGQVHMCADYEWSCERPGGCRPLPTYQSEGILVE